MDADFWFGRLVPCLGLCGWEGLQPGSPCEDLSIRVYKLNKVLHKILISVPPTILELLQTLIFDKFPYVISDEKLFIILPVAHQLL